LKAGIETFGDPYNPVEGFKDIYSSTIRDAICDLADVKSPETGEPIRVLGLGLVSMPKIVGKISRPSNHR